MFEEDRPLEGLRVLDLSDGIAGGYGAKLLSDAGASVTKVELEKPDRLRLRAAGERLPLFEHLHAGHRVVPSGGKGETVARSLLVDADIILLGSDHTQPSAAIRDLMQEVADRPAVLACVSPFGSSGPLCDIAVNEFILQAMCGKLISTLGYDDDRAPVAAGGEPGLWLTGAYLALTAIAYLKLAAEHGRRVEVDVSVFEAMACVFGQDAIGGQMRHEARSEVGLGHQVPGIHKARDAYVSFAVVTAQQWSDFCVLIGQYDWSNDRELASAAGRMRRITEVVPKIEEWVAARTADEILETAAPFRIPVGAVMSGSTSTQLECYQDFFEEKATGFKRPGSAVRFGTMYPRSDRPIRRARPSRRPLAGLVVADFTAFWAGPYAGSLLALLGAQVVHVEGPTRPDGMRTRSTRSPSESSWLEWSPIFHANNGSKLAVSVDMDTPDGMAVARALIAECDGVIENFSPRVMDHFHLSRHEVAAISPGVVYVRMPSFGLDNPWRDRPAFQHTIEPLAGISWISGYPDGDPMPTMVCDGLGGVHAAFGMVCGFYATERTRNGAFVEVRLSEVAAAVAAEQTVMASAADVIPQRKGNRSQWGLLQGVFDCYSDGASARSWIAVSADNSDQLRSIAETLDCEPTEALLREWCATRTTSQIIGELRGNGVPVAELTTAADLFSNEQLRARSFFASVLHPLCGSLDYFGLPGQASLSGTRLPTSHYAAAPVWGQHNDELSRLTRIDAKDLQGMVDDGVIGTADLTPSPM
jgi:crotonobetainyl-CoA:carnitine CoA-transferase CaiB-like acyl-CoA transferase